MLDFSGMLQLQGMILLLLALGIWFRRRGIVSGGGVKSLTNLVVDLLLPCNILQSFEVDFDPAILIKMEVILVSAIAILAFSFVLGRLLYGRQEPGRRAVLQYATLCSNSGMIGSAVAEGLYGAQGLLYASVYLVPARTVMWSVGVAHFTKAGTPRETVKKVVTQPCIVATALGLVLMVTGFRLPGVLERTVGGLGGCSTPISLFLIGTLLSEVDLRTVADRTTLGYSFVRLMLIPGCTFVVCLLCGMDPMLIGLSVILAGMPAASTTAILAARYEGDAVLASKCVLLSTLLSIPSIALWSLILLYL